MSKLNKCLMLLSLFVFFSISHIEAGSNQYGSPYDDTLPLKSIGYIFETADIDGKIFSFKGTVTAQCKSDGCWLKLKDETGEVQVDLKPYDFRIPSDITGSTIKLIGKINTKNGKYKLDAISVVVLQ